MKNPLRTSDAFSAGFAPHVVGSRPRSQICQVPSVNSRGASIQTSSPLPGSASNQEARSIATAQPVRTRTLPPPISTPEVVDQVGSCPTSISRETPSVVSLMMLSTLPGDAPYSSSVIRTSQSHPPVSAARNAVDWARRADEEITRSGTSCDRVSAIPIALADRIPRSLKGREWSESNPAPQSDLAWRRRISRFMASKLA